MYITIHDNILYIRYCMDHTNEMIDEDKEGDLCERPPRKRRRPAYLQGITIIVFV